MTVPQLRSWRKLLAIAFALVIGCGDDWPGSLTWRDAFEVWAADWCELAERCYPTYYTREFQGSRGACFKWTVWDNCTHDNLRPCDAVYPHDEALLVRCSYEWHADDCQNLLPPDSCGQAFNPVGAP